MIDKEAIKDRVLTENTAQGILNHLHELESNRERMQRRWIWELLQNARDASVDDDTHLVASVKVGDGEVVFRHNGRGFTTDEVAHLIYHGSTKIEDENTIGRYGSGFLTTHLLSPVISISGQLQDRRPFQFRLKREMSSVKALIDSMDQAWNNFDSSAAETSSTFTTQFSYPIEDAAVGAVDEGIATLKRCAPFVVAFNRQFLRIEIESLEDTIRFEVVDRSLLHEGGLQMVTVRVEDGKIQREHKFILAESENLSVAVSMDPVDDGLVCVPLEEIPRLFLGFPLIGTESFSFPAVINSLEFSPTENRDGIFLGQSDNRANKTNQRLIKEACKLHIKLLEYIARHRWASVHELAYIPSIQGQSWLNSNWLHEQLSRLVIEIRDTPAVRHGEHLMTPRQSILPLASEIVGVETLWNLMNRAMVLQKGLPERNETVGWYKAVRSWEPFVDPEVDPIEESYDGSKLVSRIEEEAMDSYAECRTIDKLQSALCEGVSAVEWLDQVYRFLLDDGLGEVIRRGRVILNQAGSLGELSSLYRDVNIDDELKNLGDSVLDLEIRESLRDSRLSSLVGEIGRGDFDNKQVAHKIADRLRILGKDDAVAEAFAQAAPRFLAWIVANKQWSYLMDFPAYSEKPRDGDPTILWLHQREADDAEMPLAPIGIWAEDLQEYSDLFPWKFIMAAEFSAAMPEVDAWQHLSEQGYVRTEVVYHSKETVKDFLPDEHSLEGDHRSTDVVPVTGLSFLSKDRVGIVARVRDSHPRARLFWRFLTEWLTIYDSEGLVPKVAHCECGSRHSYYPASWLLPVVRNSWVPQGETRVRSTAESIAKLLRDSGWTPDSLGNTEEVSRLLRAIRVTRLELMKHFIVSDAESRSAFDDTITEILVSTRGDLSHVRNFVEDMEIDEHLPEYLSERRERRRIVHENQRLGDLVENLVRQGLEEEGFTVRRTGIGSDFEIEYDVVEGEEEIGIELSRNDNTWLVEVKATREQSARMTAKQAETAVAEKDRFLLCVVPVGPSCKNLEADDVIANMRFVENMGPRLMPLCVELGALNELRADATAASGGDVQLEIEAGTARVRVDDSAWQDGICLGDLAAHLIGD